MRKTIFIGCSFVNSIRKRLSNIFDNAGQVSLGILVLGPLFNGQDSYKFGAIITLGLFLTISLWWISLRLERIS